MKTTNNKLQFDLQLKQKLDMITKGLSFKMKASYNGAYAINKNAYAKKATYTPVSRTTVPINIRNMVTKSS